MIILNSLLFFSSNQSIKLYSNFKFICHGFSYFRNLKDVFAVFNDTAIGIASREFFCIKSIENAFNAVGRIKRKNKN